MPRDHDAEQQRKAGFDDPDLDVTAVRPATIAQQEAREALLDAIEDYHHAGSLPLDVVERKQVKVWEALDRFRDACYAEVDDEHYFGKSGLDATRDLVKAATPYHSAHIVSTERLRELAELIGVEVQS